MDITRYHIISLYISVYPYGRTNQLMACEKLDDVSSFHLRMYIFMFVLSLSLHCHFWLVQSIFVITLNMDPGQPGDMCLDMSLHILESPKLGCLSSKGDRTVPSIDFPTGRFPKRNASKIRGTASQKK